MNLFSVSLLVSKLAFIILATLPLEQNSINLISLQKAKYTYLKLCSTHIYNDPIGRFIYLKLCSTKVRRPIGKLCSIQVYRPKGKSLFTRNYVLSRYKDPRGKVYLPKPMFYPGKKTHREKYVYLKLCSTQV